MGDWCGMWGEVRLRGPYRRVPQGHFADDGTGFERMLGEFTS